MHLHITIEINIDIIKMKKRFLFPLFGLFLTLIAGCSDDLNEQTNNGGPASDAKNYLSINIVTATKTGTRADAEDGRYPMPDNGPLYQDGTTEENYVQSVCLFFFDSSGNAAPINDKNESSICMDIQPSDNNGGEDHSTTVEKILKTTFEITSSTGKLPTQVLAILNPTPYIKSLTRPSLTTLRNIVRDFKTSTDEENKINLTNNNFVMSNSVYAENGKPVYATALSNEDYHTSADEADKHPVSIFVERVLARLDLIISPDLTNTAVETLTLYKATSEGDDIEGEETAVYAKFLDWNITTTPKKSRLIKEINPAWPDQFFGEYEPWNAANYHRSFWAINPEGLTYPGTNRISSA